MSKLWYNTPAATWNHALPLGNGYMGAMCFGGTLMDRWSLNDDTMWSGGFLDRLNPDAADTIPKVQQLLREKRVAEAEELTEEAILSLPEGQRIYEVLCELTVQFKTDTHPRYFSPLEGLGYPAGSRTYRRGRHC